jgi:hypothetical protein
MPQMETPSLPVATLERNALRIVLFGMPDAGKSSLLGALAQAAQTQEHVLNGHLTDLSQGLAALQHRLYEDTPRETLEEVVPYAVAFEPFTPMGPNTRNARLEAILVDCDGRVANELLARRRSLDTTGSAGSLAQAILEADTLILAVDVSAPPAQMEADFGEFGRFLRLLETSRGRRSAVGGLPVFLVLTKCDLVAQPTDTVDAWMDRIEEQKRQVHQRFQKFLARQRAEGPLPFGSIDFHLWATAVKRPVLAGSVPRPRDPYGVAELFRQCLESAHQFRQRSHYSQRRLLWTLAGTGGVLAVMVAWMAFLLAQRQESRPSALAARIDVYRFTEGSKTPSERLRGSLERKRSELRDLRNDPDFDHLPPEDRRLVQDRLTETEDYINYRSKLQRVRLADVSREADLRRIETALKDELVVPAAYKQQWDQTEANEQFDNLVKGAQALRLAMAETEAEYRRWISQAEELANFTKSRPSGAPAWDEWLRQSTNLVQQTTPHPETAEIPGARSVTYAAVLGMEPVVAARRDWEPIRLRLECLRDVIAALGLAGREPSGERQPLDIPPRFPVAEARPHWQRLENLYPRFSQKIAALQLPAAVADEVQGTARNSYNHMMETGREVVLTHLQDASLDGKETVELWKSLRPWLTNPGELREWNKLAKLLAQVRDPSVKDPVMILVDFLRRDRFELDVKRLTLEIPFDHKLRPTGPLSVFHGPAAAEAAPTWVLKLSNEDGRREPQRRVTVYDFLRDSGAPLTYVPGDQFFAHLPVKKEGDDRAWLLTWARSRSALYQFECLERPARLHRRDQPNTAGDLVEDTKLTVDGERGFPRVPDLVPVVTLKKR